MKRFILTAVGLLTIIGGAHALDLSGIGVTIVSQRQEGNGIAYQAKDTAGHAFTVVVSGTPTKKQISMIDQTVKFAFSWKEMKVSYLRVILRRDSVQALVIPADYTHDGLDLLPYLPAGMQFYLNGRTEYDFRMKAENFFIRMKGQFLDEKQFSARLAGAARNPGLFVQRNDPEYYFRKFQEIDKNLAELAQKDSEILKSLYGTVADYQEFKKRGSAFFVEYRKTTDELEAKIKGLREDLTTLATEHASLAQAFDRLQQDYREAKAEAIRVRADYEQTKADHLKLREEVQTLQKTVQQETARMDKERQELAGELTRLRSAFITWNNTALFRGPRPVSQEVVDAVLAAHDRDPEATVKQIVAALKEQQLKATSREVKLILLAYRALW